MALTLEYSVTNLKVKDEVNSEGATLSNAVVQTYWKVIGTDENGNEGEFQGATPFTAANVPEEDFVSFDNLQEEDVLTWIRAVVDGDQGYKQHIEAQINRQIDDQVSTEPGLPWATDVTPPLPDDAPGDFTDPAE